MEGTKNILVLPGAKWQVPLVKKIHEMGYKSFVVNPAPDSPTFQYADAHVVSDIFDKGNYLDTVKTIGVDAVISEECDIATLLVSELAEELGVRSQSRAIAELYSSKAKMREFLRDNGLPCPEFKLCHSLEECLDFYNSLGKLMIIKPLDSSSSRGVFTIHNEDELKSHFAESLSFSRKEKAVLCERYIKGTEFTVDGIKTDKGHVCLAISQKKHYDYNDNIANELLFSYDNSDYDYERLRAVNDQFVYLSKLPFGLTHAEYKYEDGEFYMIEIGARGGGNLISSDIVPCLSGYDNYEALIKMALGEKVDVIPSVKEEYKSRCAVLKFFDVPGNGGEVKAIEGEPMLKDNPCILSYSFNFQVGDRIVKADNDAMRVGYYIAWGKTREELLELMDKIDKSVRFELES